MAIAGLSMAVTALTAKTNPNDANVLLFMSVLVFLIAGHLIRQGRKEYKESMDFDDD